MCPESKPIPSQSPEIRVASLLPTHHRWGGGPHTSDQVHPECARPHGKLGQTCWRAGCPGYIRSTATVAQCTDGQGVKIIKTEVAPLVSAEVGSLNSCRWAATVPPSTTCLTTTSAAWYAERSGLLALKAGFPVPSAASVSPATEAKQGGHKVTGQQNTFSRQTENSFQSFLCGKTQVYHPQMSPKQNWVKINS